MPVNPAESLGVYRSPSPESTAPSHTDSSHSAAKEPHVTDAENLHQQENATTSVPPTDEKHDEAASPDKDAPLTLSRVRANQKLDDILKFLPSLQDYAILAEKEVKTLGNIWKETTKKARLSWGERETRIMLACLLKVEQNVGEYLVEWKRGDKVAREPIKSVDNGISKTVLTYIAWNLRSCGNPTFAEIDNGQVKNHWTKLKATWDAISSLTERSGGPFPYNLERGFADLDDSMAEEFDKLISGKMPKGHEHSHLTKAAQTVKDLGKAAWPYYQDMARIFDKKGSSATVTGTYAKNFTSRNKNSKEPVQVSQLPILIGCLIDRCEMRYRREQAGPPAVQQGTVKELSRGPEELLSENEEHPYNQARSSKQRHTIDAVSEVGEGNKAMANALSQNTQQEMLRLDIDNKILEGITAENNLKAQEMDYQRHREAAEAVSLLPEFDKLDTEEQFAIQDWITRGNHATEFLKVIPKIRGAWLMRKWKHLEVE
ncbi:hypothetical protein QFC24_002428 [Naganishia onofrii]|uniref:Uncharacterized protein n=1 Tax=Naganishia onofrii TaxID=1851511 RepID=A0ACC2XR88_9TREE|nr:hypothetical protein QFC24_002428 [Naganishia onofrii]